MSLNIKLNSKRCVHYINQIFNSPFAIIVQLQFKGSDSEYFTKLDDKKAELIAQMQDDVKAHEKEIVDLLVERAFKFE